MMYCPTLFVVRGYYNSFSFSFSVFDLIVQDCSGQVHYFRPFHFVGSSCVAKVNQFISCPETVEAPSFGAIGRTGTAEGQTTHLKPHSQMLTCFQRQQEQYCRTSLCQFHACDLFLKKKKKKSETLVQNKINIRDVQGNELCSVQFVQRHRSSLCIVVCHRLQRYVTYDWSVNVLSCHRGVFTEHNK